MTKGWELRFPPEAKLEKWFPLQGERAHSLYFWSFQQKKKKKKRGGGTEQQQTYQFPPRL